MPPLDDAARARLEPLDVYASFSKAEYRSSKNTAYFQVYEELFSRFRNRQPTFVEIGVQHGGSLFMWRDYFGPGARIIGIDVNPAAKQWEAAGFEIHIGDQADPRFWTDFFAAVGTADIVLDDGGHTNRQQVVTAHHCIPHIRDRGMLLVEDTGTSYMKAFGNPSSYSFINYAKRMIDRIHSRTRALPASDPAWAVYSLAFYDAMVCFHVDRSKCFVSAPIANEGRLTQSTEGVKQRQAPAVRGERLRFLRELLPNALWSLWWRLRSRDLKKYFS